MDDPAPEVIGRTPDEASELLGVELTRVAEVIAPPSCRILVAADDPYNPFFWVSTTTGTVVEVDPVARVEGPVRLLRSSESTGRGGADRNRVPVGPVDHPGGGWFPGRAVERAARPGGGVSDVRRTV